MRHFEAFPTLEEQDKITVVMGVSKKQQVEKTYLSQHGIRKLLEASADVPNLRAWLGLYRAAIEDILAYFPTIQQMRESHRGQPGLTFSNIQPQMSSRGIPERFLNAGADHLNIDRPLRGKQALRINRGTHGVTQRWVLMKHFHDKASNLPFEKTREELEAQAEMLKGVPFSEDVPKITLKGGKRGPRKPRVIPDDTDIDPELLAKRQEIERRTGRKIDGTMRAGEEGKGALSGDSKCAQPPRQIASQAKRLGRFIDHLDTSLARECKTRSANGLKNFLNTQLATLRGIKTSNERVLEAIRKREELLQE